MSPGFDDESKSVRGIPLPSVDDPSFRDNGLDVIRLFLALAVIHSHSWFVIPPIGEQDLMTRLTGGEMNCGALAVNLFFALSGYLVSASWQRLGSTVYGGEGAANIPGVCRIDALAGFFRHPDQPENMGGGSILESYSATCCGDSLVWQRSPARPFAGTIVRGQFYPRGNQWLALDHSI